jgi:hypothetical protein
MGALVAALVVVLIGFSVGDLKYSKRWADILMLIFVGMVQRAPETRRMGPAESHWIRLVNPDTAHLRITLFPRGRYREGPFELHITARGRVYMFQEGGGWHVTNNRSSGIAIAKDPSPVPGGVLRVAPVETTVNGVIVMRSFWIREGFERPTSD